MSNCPLWTNHLSPFRVSPPLSVPIPDSHEDGQTIEPCAGGGDAGRSQRRHHIVHPRGARPVADRRRPTADTPAPGGGSSSAPLVSRSLPRARRSGALFCRRLNRRFLGCSISQIRLVNYLPTSFFFLMRIPPNFFCSTEVILMHRYYLLN